METTNEDRHTAQSMYRHLGISDQVYQFSKGILDQLQTRFEEIDQTAEYNQLKVLKAMQDNKVSEACLLGTTGYGYNDLGRETLEAVYASPFSYGGCTGPPADHVRDTCAGFGSDEQSAPRRRTFIAGW